MPNYEIMKKRMLDEGGSSFIQFCAYMAGTVIYPELCCQGVYMWMGIPDCDGDIIDPKTKEYTYGISSTF